MLSNYALRSNLGYSSNQHEAVRGFEPILAQCDEESQRIFGSYDGS